MQIGGKDMSMRVWKFPILPTFEGGTIKGTPLYIGLDPRSQEPAVWCLCDPGSTEEPRPMPYVMVMTGADIPEHAGEYVTTVPGIQGWIVAHFFRRKDTT
jgi:hypothetical protein